VILGHQNDADISGRLDAILNKGMQEGVFPGATLWIGRHGETIKCSAYGKAAPDGYHLQRPVTITTKTLYDLASLTKVVATTCVIAQLIEKGLVRLTDTVAQFIPLFASDQQKASITIWHLLTHTSGLPSLLLHKEYQGKDNILKGVCQQTLLFSPGTRYFYTDLGFILLGAIVYIATSLEISEYAGKYLFAPLEMKDTMFNPPETIWNRVAPTEYVPWRGGLVQGHVHDENAWALDGVAGHAGLFSTVEDLAKFSNMILGCGELAGKSVLEASSIFEMMKPQINFEGNLQGLGWMINTPSYMGSLANIDTIGRTGFTGTSIVLNLRHRLAFVLLTNRVCPTRNGPDITPYRRGIADILAELCGV